jgi:CD109 antigen
VERLSVAHPSYLRIAKMTRNHHPLDLWNRMCFSSIILVALLLNIQYFHPSDCQPSKFFGVTGNEINRDLTQQEPTYFVLASKTLRPGQVYRVSVTVYRSNLPITARASIQRNGVELASTVQECKERIPETLLLRVPPTSIPGQYKLRVEGNVNGVLGGTAFWNETYLDFSQRSMTIFVTTDKPIYMQGQTVRFRAFPITTDLKAFADAIDIYMIDPRGSIMRRWLSRQSNLGAVSLEYPLSQQPVYGQNWTIRVIAQGQVEEKQFAVEEYYQTRFEVNVSMPAFFLQTDRYIYGSIMAK